MEDNFICSSNANMEDEADCHEPPAGSTEQMSDSLLSKILKLPEDSNSSDTHASSEFPNDLHAVDDWFKPKNDSMSGLDFESDLKNSDLDIGDLFNLKGILQTQLISNDVSGSNSNKLDNASVSTTCGKSDACVQQEKVLSLTQGVLRTGSIALQSIDKGIFEEMLLTDSFLRMNKSKYASSFEGSDINKSSGDMDEGILPTFQEILANNPTAEKKELMRMTQNCNLSNIPMDFEAQPSFTSNEQLNNLINGSFLKSKINRDNSFSINSEESSSKEQYAMKNLLSSAPLSELSMDDLHCNEISVTEDAASLPSEFFSAAVASAGETDSRLSSILSLSAHGTDNEGGSLSSCKDLLDTIDKNFLKSDLGINPHPDLRPAKHSNISTGTSINNITGMQSAKGKCDDVVLANKSLRKVSSNSTSYSSPTVCEKSLSTNEASRLYSEIVRDSKSHHLHERNVRSLVLGESKIIPTTFSGTFSYAMNSKCTQFTSSNEKNTNPVLRIIQEQKKASANISKSKAHANKTSTDVSSSSSSLPTSLILSAVKPAYKVSIPDNLNLALQEIYKKDNASDTMSAQTPTHNPNSRRSKIVRITKTNSSLKPKDHLPQIRIKSSMMPSSPTSKPVVIASSPHKTEDLPLRGQAKVVMSVDAKANTTTVSVTSSNSKLTVFRINTCDLVQAVSCVREDQLDPIGLVPSQLIQRAETANKFIKNMQLENGLLTEDECNAGKLSQSQNFEINQMLPELRPLSPMAKNNPLGVTSCRDSSAKAGVLTDTNPNLYVGHSSAAKNLKQGKISAHMSMVDAAKVTPAGRSEASVATSKNHKIVHSEKLVPILPLRSVAKAIKSPNKPLYKSTSLFSADNKCEYGIGHWS